MELVYARWAGDSGRGCKHEPPGSFRKSILCWFLATPAQACSGFSFQASSIPGCVTLVSRPPLSKGTLTRPHRAARNGMVLVARRSFLSLSTTRNLKKDSSWKRILNSFEGGLTFFSGLKKVGHRPEEAVWLISLIMGGGLVVDVKKKY